MEHGKVKISCGAFLCVFVPLWLIFFATPPFAPFGVFSGHHFEQQRRVGANLRPLNPVNPVHPVKKA
jgi:hypothetical protein